METKFTPVESGIGGALIGLSALVAYQADGKITGISGILGPFLKSVVKCEAGAQLWKLYFLLGLVLGGLINYGFNAPFAFPGPEPFTMARYVVAGFSLGLGTRFQRGCTSGHGICGLPRFSKRSWLAVPLFMLFAGLVVYLTRHVMQTGEPNKAGIAPLQWPPSWEFALCTVAASLLLAVLSFAPLPGSAHGVICPLAAGTIFGLGLGVAGMTSQAKVLNFLDVAGYWDPSLAFVMGCGILVSFPAFYLAEAEGAKPRCAESFEKPSKSGDYATLTLGAILFGIGWGLVGICPGPALAGTVPNLLTSTPAGYGFAVCAFLTAITWVATDLGLQADGLTTGSDQKPLLHK